MNHDIQESLKEIILDTLKKHPDLYQNSQEPLDWYEKRKFFLDQNQFFLKEVENKDTLTINHLPNYIKEVEKEMKRQKKGTLSSEELFFMQKLFLIYPDHISKKLLSLPWETIKILLNLCQEEKRNVYIDLCVKKKLDSHTLEMYILNDLYEKMLLIMQEVKDYEVVTSSEFLDQILTIYPIVWQ